MHGDSPARVAEKVADMRRRREKHAICRPCNSASPDTLSFATSHEEAEAERKRITDVNQNAAGYQNYQQWLAGTQLEKRVSLEDYSVSNRGLGSGLVGTPEQVSERVEEFEAAGVNLLLLQASPQLEEMERFAEQIIRPEQKAVGARIG